MKMFYYIMVGNMDGQTYFRAQARSVKEAAKKAEQIYLEKGLNPKGKLIYVGEMPHIYNHSFKFQEGETT